MTIQQEQVFKIKFLYSAIRKKPEVCICGQQDFSLKHNEAIFIAHWKCCKCGEEYHIHEEI